MLHTKEFKGPPRDLRQVNKQGDSKKEMKCTICSKNLNNARLNFNDYKMMQNTLKLA